MALLHNVTLRGIMPFVFTAGVVSAANGATYVYVSNADDADVTAYVLDRSAGSMTPIEHVPAAKLVMPMTAAQSGRHLYAASRTRPFSVFSYRVDADSGRLAPLGTSPLPESMVSMTLDATGKWLIAVSYGANLLSVHAVEKDGRIAPDAVQVLPSGGINPHAARLDRGNRWLYVPCLNSDEIRIFPFDDGSGHIDERQVRVVAVPKGTGPRHLAFSPDERFMYVLGELTGNVLVFARDAASGQLTPLQSAPAAGAETMPVMPHDGAPHGPHAADIHVRPDGRFLYTSERGQSVIGRFKIDAVTGRLRFVDKVPTEAQPRGFAIDATGRWMVVSGQASDTISLYAIDAGTGALRLRQKIASGKGANWVAIVDTPERSN